MINSKIIPNIWFKTENGSISIIINYYKNIFRSDLIEGQIISLGETPGGYTEMCEVQIFGQKYSFLSTEKEHHQFLLYLTAQIFSYLNCLLPR